MVAVDSPNCVAVALTRPAMSRTCSISALFSAICNAPAACWALNASASWRSSTVPAGSRLATPSPPSASDRL